MTNLQLRELLVSYLLLLRMQAEEPTDTEIGAAIIRNASELKQALTDYVEDADYLAEEPVVTGLESIQQQVPVGSIIYTVFIDMVRTGMTVSFYAIMNNKPLSLGPTLCSLSQSPTARYTLLDNNVVYIQTSHATPLQEAAECLGEIIHQNRQAFTRQSL